MGFDTKTYYRLTDRQSQCDFDFENERISTSEGSRKVTRNQVRTVEDRQEVKAILAHSEWSES
jgi:hypothetical protein